MPWNEEPCLIIILMLGECFAENCHWRLNLGMSLVLRYKPNLLKSPVLVTKHPFGVSSGENGSLGKLGHRGFIAFLVIG